jgi:hypothetical protein
MDGRKPACLQCLECACIYDTEKGDPKGVSCRGPLLETFQIPGVPGMQSVEGEEELCRAKRIEMIEG